MPRFAANLSMLWPELEVYDRFAAAADAGFSRVEILFVHALDISRIEQLLHQHHLALVLFDPAPGDWEAGERGLLSLPGREADFQHSVEAAVDTAQRLGVPRLNCLAGIPPAGVNSSTALQTAVENLRAAAPRAQRAGVILMVENINTTDMPGYFANTAGRAAEIVSAAQQPNVRLQLDQYHVGMAGEDARAALREHLPLVEHVQVADVPGRHEPGSGHQPIAEFLNDLDTLGYTGCVGLEYRPSTTTESALAWLPRDQRG